jgi:hypothetical protein
VELIRLKSQSNELFIDDPLAICHPHGESPDRTHPVEVEAKKLENVLRKLNALLEKHHTEWLAMPQPERAEAVLRVLSKL